MVFLYSYWGALLPEVPKAERPLQGIRRRRHFYFTVMQLHCANKSAVEIASLGHAARTALSTRSRFWLWLSRHRELSELRAFSWSWACLPVAGLQLLDRSQVDSCQSQVWQWASSCSVDRHLGLFAGGSNSLAMAMTTCVSALHLLDMIDALVDSTGPGESVGQSTGQLVGKPAGQCAKESAAGQSPGQSAARKRKYFAGLGPRQTRSPPLCCAGMEH